MPMFYRILRLSLSLSTIFPVATQAKLLQNHPYIFTNGNSVVANTDGGIYFYKKGSPPRLIARGKVQFFETSIAPNTFDANELLNEKQKTEATDLALDETYDGFSAEIHWAKSSPRPAIRGFYRRLARPRRNIRLKMKTMSSDRRITNYKPDRSSIWPADER